MDTVLSSQSYLQGLGSDIPPRLRASSRFSKTPTVGPSRSARLMNILSYSAFIHILGFVATYYVLDWFDMYMETTEGEVWNWQALVAVIILVPGTVAVVTTLSPMVTTLPAQSSSSEKRKWDHLYLCLVSKGTNRETVFRSVSQMRHLQLDDRIRLVLLTEEGRDFTDSQLGCDVVFVPHNFTAPFARYKARALEYFRQFQPLGDRDWVLHLDEETLVDDHCVSACVDFIERTQWEWGQGIITYNTVNYWENPILTFAEVLRFRDDLGRFQFQHGRVHKAVWGCHGSFLLSSGRVENAVRWDTACLAEDFWFASQANQIKYDGGFVPSVAREQSNYTIMDFLNQRRRWFCGMVKAGFFGKLMTITWFLSIFESVLALSSWAGLFGVPHWVTVWMHIYFSCSTFTVLFAMLVQDLDADVPLWRIVLHLVYAPVLSLIVQVLQMTVIAYSILSPPKGFHVVVKK